MTRNEQNDVSGCEEKLPTLRALLAPINPLYLSNFSPTPPPINYAPSFLIKLTPSTAASSGSATKKPSWIKTVLDSSSSRVNGASSMHKSHPLLNRTCRRLINYYQTFAQNVHLNANTTWKKAVFASLRAALCPFSDEIVMLTYDSRNR